MRVGEDPVKKYNRDSLRVLGSVGEPINPEAWLWYHRVVGDSRCSIVDTWWQTETGGAALPFTSAPPTTWPSMLNTFTVFVFPFRHNDHSASWCHAYQARICYKTFLRRSAGSLE